MGETSGGGQAGFQFGKDLSTSDNCREVSRKGGIACSKGGVFNWQRDGPPLLILSEGLRFDSPHPCSGQ